jgi:hypothetical protein
MAGARPSQQLLADTHEIRNVLASYCRGVDRLDRELARSCWHTGATVEYVDVFTGSAMDFLDICFRDHLGYAAHSHQIANTIISVHGDVAVSETYLTARLRSKPDPSGRCVDTVVCGRYLDRWSFRDDRWAIDHRTFVSDIHSNFDVDRSVDSSSYRRDPLDRSYAELAPTRAAGGLS